MPSSRPGQELAFTYTTTPIKREPTWHTVFPSNEIDYSIDEAEPKTFNRPASRGLKEFFGVFSIHLPISEPLHYVNQ